jgi:rubredoxin
MDKKYGLKFNLDGSVEEFEMTHPICSKCGYEYNQEYWMGGSCSGFDKVKGNEAFIKKTDSEWECPKCSNPFYPDKYLIEHFYIYCKD